MHGEHFVGDESNLGPIQHLLLLLLFQQQQIIIMVVYYHCVEEKSKDKDSPAYLSTLFSYTDAPVKNTAEKNLARWEAVKRRQLSKDLMTISTEPEEEETNYSSDEEGEIDGVIVTDTHRSLNIQIDLTLKDLRNVEFDKQKHIEEVYTLQGHNSG